MRVHLDDTFLSSLARLDGRAAAAVKRAAFDLLACAARPGLRLHRLVHSVDRGFWSLRVNRDLRLIVHRAGPDLVLCYADHHDRAYAWAAQRTMVAPGEEGAPLELSPPASPRWGPRPA